ncbi:MAG: hypothetical protein ACO3DQ_03610, partial [Cephaloticoccus sp.]
MTWWVGLNLVFLPWALGGMRVWTLYVGVGIALAGMITALLPRTYVPKQRGDRDDREVMWPKLLRFPLFWLGLALLVLVLIQALNPSWILKHEPG